jgi:hypothetical protein
MRRTVAAAEIHLRFAPISSVFAGDYAMTCAARRTARYLARDGSAVFLCVAFHNQNRTSD